jgi:transcriptional regulator with XRE-family HTH domain
VRTELGDFLRARRRLVRPADVGLPGGTGLRRVPGLRREEVALLAGISAEYYLRLEQGRDRTPSSSVIEALARVLRLGDDGQAHLLALAQPARRRRQAADHVPEGLAALVETLNVPAFVINRYRDVLAANRLAEALSPLMAPGVNRLVAVFTDPLAREYHPDLDQQIAGYVAQFRAEAGTDPDDPRVRELVAELSGRSEQFRTLWARHDIARGGSESSLIRHPRLGDLHLRREKLAVIGAEGLQLVLYHSGVGPAGGHAPLVDLAALADDDELVDEVDGGADVVRGHA